MGPVTPPAQHLHSLPACHLTPSWLLQPCHQNSRKAVLRHQKASEAQQQGLNQPCRGSKQRVWC